MKMDVLAEYRIIAALVSEKMLLSTTLRATL
jgi:hypothetical protein